ncbi:hypothetical protein TeGR_g14552 [Tetraparma gracilis]|uniref:Uncharacterized protein n=1 Tax=Tetraparma gracilis TaxID=2962635 RepID=A0ABQ6N210_9STRA|nr:hypothetical protein TeGR_g14552 [Tetraparma gracilis]
MPFSPSALLLSIFLLLAAPPPAIAWGTRSPKQGPPKSRLFALVVLIKCCLLLGGIFVFFLVLLRTLEWLGSTRLGVKLRDLTWRKFGVPARKFIQEAKYGSQEEQAQVPVAVPVVVDAKKVD